MDIRPLKVTVREVVAGYEDNSDREEGIHGYGGRLDIRPKYQRNYIYDDAGAYYANMTLFHTGRGDAKAKCKVFPCLEIRDWPQFKWRGVMVDDSRHFMGKDTILRILEQMSWFKVNGDCVTIMLAPNEMVLIQRADKGAEPR